MLFLLPVCQMEEAQENFRVLRFPKVVYGLRIL
jgi:hypothetical protein